MNAITTENLKEILASHVLWLMEDTHGERADLSDANLRNANLSNADLSDANLSNANLSYADLRGADLSNAGLRGADLRGADLRNADLHEASCGMARMPRGWWCMDQRYSVHVCAEYIEIGCKKYTGTEWEAFSDVEIAAMDPQALAWRQDFGVLVIGKWHEIKAGEVSDE